MFGMTTTKPQTDPGPGNTNDELDMKLTEHEAGVADLLAAYEAAEPAYFAAVKAAAPHPPRSIASNSTWLPDADLG